MCRSEVIADWGMRAGLTGFEPATSWSGTCGAKGSVTEERAVPWFRDRTHRTVDTDFGRNRPRRSRIAGITLPNPAQVSVQTELLFKPQTRGRCDPLILAPRERHHEG